MNTTTWLRRLKEVNGEAFFWPASFLFLNRMVWPELHGDNATAVVSWFLRSPYDPFFRLTF